MQYQVYMHGSRHSEPVLPPSYEELAKENQQLRSNLETLLQYNSKLLGIIEDMNKEPPPSVTHERCAEEAKFLWKKLSALESYSYQLEMELEHYRADKHNTDDQIQKELREVLANNEVVQKKFQNKIIQVMREIQQIKSGQDYSAGRLVQFLQDREQKVQQVYDQFQYKDQIIELLTQKVRLFQEEYSRHVMNEGMEAQLMSIPAISEEKHTQTEVRPTRQSMSEYQDVRERDRVIQVYEGLMRKIKTKLEQKVG